MFRLLCRFLVITASSLLLSGSVYWENVYLTSTDFRFPVVRIAAETEKHPVVLIFGGIHGDEPGAYLAAEKLAEARLTKGTLILLPRVNFYSIMKNVRGFFGDMNRKFEDENFSSLSDPDRRIVSILKSLMGEADVFINLHDAWGFHARSPGTFGQSLIIDGAKALFPKNGQPIDIEALGGEAVRRANKELPRAQRFALWNHRTDEKQEDLRLEEMKSSASYFAYKSFQIPSFGLEVSKNISSDQTKVKHHLLVLRELFRALGVQFESFPDSKVLPPELRGIELSGPKGRFFLPPGSALNLSSPGPYSVTRIWGNRRFGWSVKLAGKDGENLLDKPFLLREGENLTLFVGQDFDQIGKGTLRVAPPPSLSVTLDGRPMEIPLGMVLSLRPGETISFDTEESTLWEKIDLKGFQPPDRINRSDDRGHPVSADKMQRRFALDTEGRYFPLYGKKGQKTTFFALLEILEEDLSPASFR